MSEKLHRQVGRRDVGELPSEDVPGIVRSRTHVNVRRPKVTPRSGTVAGTRTGDRQSAFDCEKLSVAISDVLHGCDDRLIVVVGPCSIHEPDQDIDHAFAEPDIKSRFQVFGYEAFDISRAKLPAFVAGESAKYGEVIRRTKISLD